MTRNTIRIAAMFGFGAVAFAGDARAQGSDARWLVRGDIGAVLGGTWLAGKSAPTVSAGPGVALSLDLQRAYSRRFTTGGALRLHAQPLQLREHEVTWDGGTLTDVQLLGTLAVALYDSNKLRTALELGGGVAVLAGARELYPFSTAGRVTPAAEVGVSVQRGDGGGSRTLSLVARYGVVRLDPGPTSAINFDAMTGAAGWVARTTLGVRIQR